MISSEDEKRYELWLFLEWGRPVEGEVGTLTFFINFGIVHTLPGYFSIFLYNYS